MKDGLNRLAANKSYLLKSNTYSTIPKPPLPNIPKDLISPTS